MAIESYLDLITSEHRDKPKFIALVSATLNQLDDIGTAASSLPSAFDVDNAIGAQLDVVGTLVGANRNIGIPLTSGSSILDDDYYRLLIKAKIAQNSWNGTIPGLYALWQTVFGNSSTLQIIDNQDMTMQAVVTGMEDIISSQLVQAGLIIPKPMGVGLTIIEQTPITDTPYIGSIIGGGYDVVSLTTVMP